MMNKPTAANILGDHGTGELRQLCAGPSRYLLHAQVLVHHRQLYIIHVEGLIQYRAKVL